METIDPTTGEALPADAIQRVLFIAPTVHVYQIPPMSSTKGHSAASWTTDGDDGGKSGKEIFTARVRIVETSFDEVAATDSATDTDTDKLKVDVVLEDRATGQLFAAAPYTSPEVAESVLDSSRFFALTVRDPRGVKAVLGIGFEERSEAFDFSVALQEARKALGWEAGRAAPGQGTAGGGAGVGAIKEDKKDYSLKEGETITVNLGGTKFGRKAREKGDATSPTAPTGGLSGFSLPPPPSGPGVLLPPPPPPAGGGRDKKRLSQSAEQLGFDDGKFGEFA